MQIHLSKSNVKNAVVDINESDKVTRQGLKKVTVFLDRISRPFFIWTVVHNVCWNLNMSLELTRDYFFASFTVSILSSSQFYLDKKIKYSPDEMRRPRNIILDDTVRLVVIAKPKNLKTVPKLTLFLSCLDRYTRSKYKEPYMHIYALIYTYFDIVYVYAWGGGRI